MQTVIKIHTDKLDHFMNMLEMSNKAGIQSGIIEVATTTNENDITMVTVEFQEPGDLFEFGKLYGKIKPDVKLTDHVIMTPGAGRAKPSFKIDFK